MYLLIVASYVLTGVAIVAIILRDVLVLYPVWRAGLMAWLLAGTSAWFWLMWGNQVPHWGEWLLHLLDREQDSVAAAVVLAAPVALVVTLLARSYYHE